MSLDVGALYEEHRETVYRYLLRRVRPRETAEDLTQEVFVRALVAAPRYDERGLPVTAWLHAIARNLLIDRARVKANRVPVDSLDCMDWLGVTMPEREDVLDLRQALPRLTDQQRRVIELRYRADLPVAETARLIGNSEDGVKKLQARALANLRRNLRGAA